MISSIETCVNSINALLCRSTALLHHIENVDFKLIVAESSVSTTPSVMDTEETLKLRNSDIEDEGACEEEEEDADDLFGMMGAFESDEEDEEVAPTTQSFNLDRGNDQERDSEEDSTLLKRAFCVHLALLDATPQILLDKNITNTDFVSNLVGAINCNISGANTFVPSSTFDAADLDVWNELVTILSFTLSPSTFNNPHKSFSYDKECWMKVCYTNSLLAIQFLLHLQQQNNGLPEIALKGWNVVIIPLMLGNMETSSSFISLLINSDPIRETLFNLSPISSHVSISNYDEYENICKSCLKSIHNAAISPNIFARKKKIIVTCQMLLQLLGLNTAVTSNDWLTIVELVKNSIHQAVLMIIRGVCYETVYSKCCDVETVHDQSTFLSLESIRPITGMLLPKLYPPPPNDSKSVKAKDMGKKSDCDNADERVNEIWSELLLLLSPYSTEVLNDITLRKEGKRRRCKNWTYVAPLTATAILCTLLPTFRELELPTQFGLNNKLRCRPALQASLWKLFRSSLGRCGDFDKAVGVSRLVGYGDTSGRGLSLLSRGNKNSSELVLTSSYDDEDNNDFECYNYTVMDQLLRRRSIHSLKLLVEHERNCISNNSYRRISPTSPEKNVWLQSIETWMKYTLVFEMLEMEVELHLVDQIWQTMKELTSGLVCMSSEDLNDRNETTYEQLSSLPPLVWEDIASILSRLLLSQALPIRKLGLYRFLNGEAGVDVSVQTLKSDSEKIKDESQLNCKKGVENTILINPNNSAERILSVALTCVSTSFVLDVIMQSYDSILGSKIGTNLNVEESGQIESKSVTHLLFSFLSNYVIALSLNQNGEDHLSKFVSEVFGPRLFAASNPRSLITFYKSVAIALKSIPTGVVVLEPVIIQGTIHSIVAEFSSGGAPRSLQNQLKHDLALALKHSKPWSTPDAMLVLQILSLYPPGHYVLESAFDSAEKNTSLEQSSRLALATWLLRLGDGQWAAPAAATLATAFVSGQLMPFGEMDYTSGANKVERDVGMALCTLCSLSGCAREMFWPAVCQGLQNDPMISVSDSVVQATRSMILLEYGCREGVFSGWEKGKSQRLLPPLPNIESILNNALLFIMSQLTDISLNLCSTIRHDRSETSGANISSTSNNVSVYIVILIEQIRVLQSSFPSSVSLSASVNSILRQQVIYIEQTNCFHTNTSINDDPADIANRFILLFAALSCGAVFDEDIILCDIIMLCRTLLRFEFSVSSKMSTKKGNKQALRSIFHYAKWGCLSLITPMIMDRNELSNCLATDPNLILIQDLSQEILAVVTISVDATPGTALQPLFRCALSAGKILARLNAKQSLDHQLENSYISSIQSTIDALFAVLKEKTSSSTWTDMLHQTCKLIFSPELLLQEYKESCMSGKLDKMPILHAFEKLLHMAGTSKPFICKTAVSQISSAWLGLEGSKDAGISAIPYIRHIVDLLLYKEGKVDESAAHQITSKQEYVGFSVNTVDSSSVTRSFVLYFFSRLPSPEMLSKTVLHELVHIVIDQLLDICCTGPAPGKSFISGSEEYGRMIRAWQALCLLSRFVTYDVSEKVAVKLFQAMSENTLGAIRYFMEIFSIQCTRNQPSVFCPHYIREVKRSDLSLQYVSSLMVIGGNVIGGRYSSTFFQCSTKDGIREVLLGVIPWLSSTQSFSRAIAQLLVHRLIPLVVEIKSSNLQQNLDTRSHDDVVLVSIYSFLSSNSEMCRLRAKQQHFFEQYDVDNVCSFDGLLSIPVDDGDEANPPHVVEAIKDCLVNIYKELHEGDESQWNEIKDLLIIGDDVKHLSRDKENIGFYDETQLVNFQRKILPIDALELSIKSYQEQKFLNAAGKKKQKLIICASLIDKVPNLAGLARTAEIFSVQSLVIPNLLVKKQDDFKTISASANDWIEMEECKEDDLLNWLYKKKSQGYFIVGVEQTSSSECITNIRFPEKTVLLLGKEKEGIPVEFLSVVDNCIEIPQLGIIRSLNVHVTGAIAIWKYTEQMMQQNGLQFT